MSMAGNQGRKVVVVIPTYNERGNLEAMVNRLRALGLSGLSCLVVDDGSPDGTGELADQLAARYPDFLSVLHRSGKLGQGTAYVAGFRWALDHGADIIAQMDADFSHSPDALPLLIAKCSEYDVAIGSRFARGGSLDERWGLSRRILSACGNAYARLVTGLTLRDVTGGFKCFRRRVLETIDLGALKSTGFAFQLEVNYACYRHGFSMTEVPIHFAERTQGASKMSLQIILEAFWRVLELRTRY